MTPILEIKHTLSGERKEYPSLLRARGPGWAIIEYTMAHSVTLADVVIPSGATSFGYYWADRPYNLYHWLQPDGMTLAFYFNISEDTEIRADAIEWHDLVVDVLVVPGQEPVVLDQDELPQGLDPARQRTIRRSLATVLASYRRVIGDAEPTSKALFTAERVRVDGG